VATGDARQLDTDSLPTTESGHGTAARALVKGLLHAVANPKVVNNVNIYISNSRKG
jgi:hypothetical protein